MTVAESIKATASKAGTCDGRPTYRGVLKVTSEWGNYTRSSGIERMTRADALEDADRQRNDWITVNQLPN